ncbi:MAG: SMR family transporter [Rhodospirillales bacterium]
MPVSSIALIATIICSGGGNALANWSHQFSGRQHLIVLAAAIGVHATGLLFFSVALTGIPLSIAYPVLIGGSMMFVTVLAAVWFKERLTVRHLAGMVLILAGMVLLKGGEAASAAAAACPAEGTDRPSICRTAA